MDPSILNHATDLVHQQDRQLDHIFSELQDMHHQVRRELESAEINKRVADEAAKEAQGRVDHLRATEHEELRKICLLYTSPSPRDLSTSRMPSSA